MLANCDSIPGASMLFERHPGKPLYHPFARELASNASPPYKFAYARTALKYGLKHLKLNAGDSVLVPEFICESAVQPLNDLALSPRYYPVTARLEPAWNQVDQLIDASTKAMIVVHYFGHPQPLEECRSFCNSRSMFLIEDNAHGFGATHNGRSLGTIGDVGVTAPRKSFPVRNGAFLYTAGTCEEALDALVPRPSSTLRLKYWAKRCLGSLPPVKAVMRRRCSEADRRKRLGPPPRYGSQEAFRELPIRKDYGMDEDTYAFLVQQDLEVVRTKRRILYTTWQQWAESYGLIPTIPELAPGAMPLVFPAFSGSITESLKWFERGHRAGIDIHSWPTLPLEIVKRNGAAMRLWERLVCFPIHQYMDVDALTDRLDVL